MPLRDAKMSLSVFWSDSIMPKNEIGLLYFTLKRGGTHAVANWLLHHYAKRGGLTCMLNCMYPHWRTYRPRHYYGDLPDGHDDPELMRAIEHGNPKWDKTCLMVGYEDFLPERHDPDFVGETNSWITIKMIRDVYNNMASRLQIQETRSAGQSLPQGWRPEKVEFWKTFAVAVADVTINFNDWFTHPFYRRSIETH